LDVGCGVGLSAIVASKLGAGRVIASDISPIALELVQASAVENGIDNMEFVQFDITSDEPLPEADVVLLGDVLYNKPLGRAVARRVKEASDRGSWVIVVSSCLLQCIYIKIAYHYCVCYGRLLLPVEMDSMHSSAH